MALSSDWISSATSVSNRRTRKCSQKLPTMRLSVVGDADAGKGHVLSALTGGRYRHTERAEVQRTVSTTKFRGTSLDVCDAPRGCDVTSNRRGGGCRVVHVLVGVYSVEDGRTLEEAVNALQEQLQNINQTTTQAALLGTWVGARPQHRQVTYKQGKDTAAALGVHFYEFACDEANHRRIQDMGHQLVSGCLKDWQEITIALSAKRSLLGTVRKYLRKITERRPSRE